MKKIFLLLPFLFLFSVAVFADTIKLDKKAFKRSESGFVVVSVFGKPLVLTQTKVVLSDSFQLLNINIANPYTVFLRIMTKKNARIGAHKCKLISANKEYPFELRVDPKPHLLADIDTYDEYFFRFRFGYEYSSMDKIFEEGFPRLGFFVNFTTRSKAYPSFGMQVNGDFMLSSTPFINRAAGVTNDLIIDKAFEFYGTVFFHFFRTEMKVGDGVLHGYFGPIITVGGTMKDDFTGKSSYQLYGGFRMSINPEVYTDFLFGESEDLEGYRFFIRARIPIYRLSQSSRLYLGAYGNFSLKSDGVDFVRIFLSADFDPVKLLTSIF